MAVVFPNSKATLQKRLHSTAHPALPAFAGLPQVYITRPAGMSEGEFYLLCVDTYPQYQSVRPNGKRYYFYTAGVTSLPDFGGVVPMIPGETDPTTGARQITLLAQPSYAAVPASTTTKVDTGWNSGGRSVDTIGDDGFFEFSLDIASTQFDRAYVGLVPAEGMPDPDGTSIHDAEYTFYLRSDNPTTGQPRSRIRRDGENISAAASKIPISVNANARYRILRTSGAITFYILDPDTGETLFRYSPAGYNPDGDLRLDVTLYKSLTAITQPIRVLPGEDNWDVAFGVSPALAINATGGPIQAYLGVDPFTRMVAEIAPCTTPLINAVDVEYTFVVAPPLQTYMGRHPFARITAEIAAPEILLIETTSSETFYTLDVGNGVDIYLPMKGAHWNAPTASFTMIPTPIIVSVDFGGLGLDFLTTRSVPVTQGATLDFTVTTELFLAPDPITDDFLFLGFSVSVVQDFNIAVDLGGLAIDMIPTADGVIPLETTDPQYVFGVDTSAPWEYTGMSFTSMVTTDDGSVFFMNPQTGLFALNGADRTRVLPAPRSTLGYAINFGGRDFGTSERKNPDSFWLGISAPDLSEAAPEDLSRGALTVSTDTSPEYVYDVQPCDPSSRVVVGRGLTGRVIRATYMWTTDRDFTLDSVEVSLAGNDKRRVP